MKLRIKKILSSLLTLSMVSVLFIGCATNNSEVVEETPATEAVETVNEVPEEISEDPAEPVLIRVGAMSGPTAMGMVKLMSDAEAGTTSNTYQFADLATEASAFVAPITTGELDIAAVPSNLAANLYNKTNGGIKVLAVNTFGVLNLLERGNSISSWSDLKGKKIYATGQGAVPEYTIRYLLKSNDLDPDNDVTLQWCSDTTEALSYVSEDTEAIAVLPQPFATAACAKVEGLRVVMDLNAEWDALNCGCNICTGVIVVRTAFAEEYPEAVANFLDEYKASVEYTASDVEGAAELIVNYGILAAAPVAQKALPNCHITYLAGSEMKTALSGFLQILYDANPDSVGGSLPQDDFYY